MKTLGAIVIAILVIAGIYWLFMRDDARIGDDNSTATTEQTDRESEETMRNSVTLAENGEGDTVTVEEATLTRPGFIGFFVVSTTTEGEVETELRGTSRFLTAGTYNDLEVALDGTLGDTETVIAVLFEDNGNGTFDQGGVDSYLGNADLSIISDADVIGTDSGDETQVLNRQVELYIESATSTP